MGFPTSVNPVVNGLVVPEPDPRSNDESSGNVAPEAVIRCIMLDGAKSLLTSRRSRAVSVTSSAPESEQLQHG